MNKDIKNPPLNCMAAHSRDMASYHLIMTSFLSFGPLFGRCIFCFCLDPHLIGFDPVCCSAIASLSIIKKQCEYMYYNT